MTPPTVQPSGALVISLDFELHWGQPTLPLSDRGIRARFLRTRAVVRRLLGLFEECEIAATWATVGFLFAQSAEEIEEVRPRRLPAYRQAGLSSFDVRVGTGEDDDPFHFAPSLVESIRCTPRQEIATHTFSHYYCLEEGQTKDDFAADLTAARAIAGRRGVQFRSIAFPRNQVNPAYRPVLIEHGITTYRGNPPGAWRAADSEESRAPARRVIRFIDSFAQWSSREGGGWDEIPGKDGLANVRATSFLRPFDRRLAPAEEIRFRRIRTTLERAARDGRIIHLWWHPHNFAAQPEYNLTFLRRILDVFATCREQLGMRSVSMSDAARIASASRGDVEIAGMASVG